jgi:hypothetical protein
MKKAVLDLVRRFSSVMRYAYQIESGKSEPSFQHPVNQRKQQMRGLPAGRYKSWQVLSIALAFCLKRVIISKD